MARFCSLQEAVQDAVHDGDVVAMEGFTHLIPFAAGHEVIRQGRRDLTLVRMTPDLIYDQLIGAGCAATLVFSWGGNPGVGSLHRLRDAVEHGWPRPLALEEYSHAAMASAYDAGAAHLPFAMFRGAPGGLADVNPNLPLGRVPVHRRDADGRAVAPAGRDGDSRPAGRPRGERDDRRNHRRAERGGAGRAPRGRHGRGSRRPVRRTGSRTPASSRTGRSPPSRSSRAARFRRTPTAITRANNAFYLAWDDISRDRDTFQAWLDEHVMNAGPGRLRRAGQAGRMSVPYTPDELMTVAAARCVGNDDVCFVGIGLPSAACNLARLTHAPRITLIYESGTIGTRPTVLPLSIGDGELCATALTTVSVPEFFRYWLQSGRISVGFLGAAQIDRFANLNTTVIGPYDRPAVRLPGAGGAPEMAAACQRIFIVMPHSRRAFEQRLDFLTSLGHGDGAGHRARLGLTTAGPAKVITDLCVMEPDDRTRS